MVTIYMRRLEADDRYGLFFGLIAEAKTGGASEELGGREEAKMGLSLTVSVNYIEVHYK